MIKEALQYIFEQSKPEYKEIGGDLYSNKPLRRVDTENYADEIKATTLSSLVDYIKSNVDGMKGKMIVHIVSPTCVRLYSQLDKYRCREHVFEVNATLPHIAMDKYIDRESFNIAMQSKFEHTPDKDLLLKFVGTVESGTIATYGDDGVSQKATIKTGIASKDDVLVPNPVCLRPYRTFTEVEQPASSFVFRMKEDKYDGITCGIFEADGGAWKNAAITNVHNYLVEKLKDVDGYLIIA